MLFMINKMGMISLVNKMVNDDAVLNQQDGDAVHDYVELDDKIAGVGAIGDFVQLVQFALEW